MSEEETFRFKTQREYERELTRILNSKKNLEESETEDDSKIVQLDEEYETLIEEYLRFVSSLDNG